MCGIVGYVGGRPVRELLLSGLTKLEYRGYDSAGVALQRNGSLDVRRAEGKLDNLAAATAMYLAYYNYCWQTRKPGKSGQKRPTAAMAAKLAGHVWSFAELFETVMPAKVAA